MHVFRLGFLEEKMKQIFGEKNRKFKKAIFFRSVQKFQSSLECLGLGRKRFVFDRLLQHVAD